MNTDSFFTIGSTHKICQDYTCHFDDMVFLSDGCSSARNTDVGARILVHSARVNSDDFFSTVKLCQDEFEDTILYELDDFNLPFETIYATILGARISKDNKIQVVVRGDGVVAAKRFDGPIEIIRYEHPDSAPWYPAYNLMASQKECYKSQFNMKIKVVTTIVDESGYDSSESFDDVDKNFIHEFDEKYKSVAIFSDGITSFIDSLNQSIHEAILVKELLDFKSLNGCFVERRVTACMKNWRKKDYCHYDDFSMAAIARG